MKEGRSGAGSGQIAGQRTTWGQGGHRCSQRPGIEAEIGRTLIPKLKMGGNLSVGLNVSGEVEADYGQAFQQEVLQVLRELKLIEHVGAEMK